MSDRSRQPLRLRPRRIESWTAAIPDFSSVLAPVYGDYSWEGRPVSVARAGECPLAWGAAHAAGYYAMTTPDYLASIYSAVPGGFGLPSRLLRRPRAVILDTPFFYDADPVTYPNPAKDALISLRDPLLTKGVFAGKVAGWGVRSLFTLGMPPSSLSVTTDLIGDDDSPTMSDTKYFTAGDAEGGEVLYVTLNDDLGFDFDLYTASGVVGMGLAPLPLSTLMEADSAYLSASAAAHDRARWLAVLADVRPDFADIAAAQKANIATVAAGASGADIEVFYTGTVDLAGSYQAVFDKVYLAVVSFFNLSL